MTREKLETAIRDHLFIIAKLYREYYENGEYMTFAVWNNPDSCTIIFNNDFWEEGVDKKVDFYGEFKWDGGEKNDIG